MKILNWILLAGLIAWAASFALYAAKTDGIPVLSGPQAFTNTASLQPGLIRKITAKDLPKPGETPSGSTPGGRGGMRPPNAMPQAPAGFKVSIYVHSASLGMTFYDGEQFPAEYSGDVFAAEHGSWNHAAGAGREVIRIPIEKGRATGVYQDFLTGFVTNGVSWGRPVGVAVARDGSLLVSDDGARVIWRVNYTGK